MSEKAAPDASGPETKNPMSLGDSSSSGKGMHLDSKPGERPPVGQQFAEDDPRGENGGQENRPDWVVERDAIGGDTETAPDPSAVPAGTPIDPTQITEVRTSGVPSMGLEGTPVAGEAKVMVEVGSVAPAEAPKTAKEAAAEKKEAAAASKS